MNSAAGKTINKSRERFHRRNRAFFVGLFITIPLIALPGFLIFTFMKADVLEKTTNVYVRYPTAAGLGKGTAVTILGMKVGYIKTIELNESDHVDVCMRINQAYLRMVKKDSKARLQQKNVAFGDWEIELACGTMGSRPVKSGDTLEGEVQAPIAKTLEQLNKTIDTFQKILQTILDGKGTVGRIINEDTLLDIAQDIGRKASEVIGHANRTLKQVDTIFTKVGVIGDKGKQLADSIVGISGKVTKLVIDIDTLVRGVQNTSKDLPGLMDKVQVDLSEVELMLKALQNNWLFKSSIQSQKDPMLDEKQ
jgi:phospholipid/cholesterol/gamma-HCH transport system substrate-binding protein